MIRDPSDGSVIDHHIKPQETLDKSAPAPVLSTTTSGLPPEAEAERARMERSREWLRKYRTNPESVIRRTGEQGDGE